MFRFLMRVNLLLILLALTLGTLSSGAYALARTAKARLVIHPDTIITQLSPRLLGSNVPLWLGDNLQNSTLLARTRASGIRTLRIPGGSTSDEYGWLSCEMRANQTSAYHCVADGWEEWAARPTDFINFIRATNIPNVIYTVNVNVTPQEAAAAVAFFNAQPSNTTNIGVDTNGFDWKTAGDWAQLRVDHGNTQPLGIQYWEIGNEVYGGTPDTGGGDCQSFGWENAWTCDGTEYINGANNHAGYAAIRAAMRAIDPTILVGAVGMENPGDYNNWGNDVISAAGSFMDYYIIHPYAYFELPPNNAQGWSEILSKPRAYLPQIKTDLSNAFDAHANGRAIPIAVTEYNVVSVQDQDDNKLMNRAGNAFFIAEFIGQAIANGYWAANQWDLTNGCAGNGTCYDLLQVDHGWKRSPQYYAFPLWARFGDTMLDVSNNRDPSTEISAYAGKIAENMYSLLVLNKTDHAYSGRVSFDNSLIVASGTADVLSAKSFSAKKVKWNGVPNPSDDLSNAPPAPLTKVGTTTRFSFPPYSITLLRMNVP